MTCRTICLDSGIPKVNSESYVSGLVCKNAFHYSECVLNEGSFISTSPHLQLLCVSQSLFMVDLTRERWQLFEFTDLRMI